MEEKLQGLATSWLGHHYVHLQEVDSTSTYLKEHAAELPHGTAVLADYQTQGKGRLGRSWSNPKGHTLAFSLLLKDDIQDAAMTLLPLIVGLGVCQALEELCGEGLFSIKWSNDVLCQEKKLCGILCESRVSAGGFRPFIVVGIGVNLMQTHQDFERLDLVYANSLLLATEKSFAPEVVAAAILNRLEPVLETYREKGFRALRDDYKKRCITLNRHVRLIQEGVEREAFVKDIGFDGGLVCQDADGKAFSVIAGETSVRGLLGYV